MATSRPRRPLDWHAAYVTGSTTISAVTARYSQANSTHTAFALIGDLADEASFKRSLDDIGESTLTRTRGFLYVTTDRPTSQTTVGHIWAAGITLLGADAFWNGSTSGAGIPDPLQDRDDDWLWYAAGRTAGRLLSYPYWNGSSLQTYSSYAVDAELYQRLEVDSRAQRRMRKGEVPCLVVSNIHDVGTPDSMSIISNIRVLLKH